MVAIANNQAEILQPLLPNGGQPAAENPAPPVLIGQSIINLSERILDCGRSLERAMSSFHANRCFLLQILLMPVAVVNGIFAMLLFILVPLPLHIVANILELVNCCTGRLAFSATQAYVKRYADSLLDTSNFQKPLILKIEAPEVRPEDQELYRELATIGNQILTEEGDGKHSKAQLIEGLNTWVKRMKEEPRFSMIPKGDKEKAKFYKRLRRYANNVLVFFGDPNLPIDCKKDFLARLSIAAIEKACGTRWMNEVVLMYKDLIKKPAFLSIDDWTKITEQRFRRSIIEADNSKGNNHLLDASLHHINKIILIPGAEDTLGEFPQGTSVAELQIKFLSLYTGKLIIDHFMPLVNGELTKYPNGELRRKHVEVDREQLAAWFQDHIPPQFLPNEPKAERSRRFLSAITHGEDDAADLPQFKAGDFHRDAVHYLLACRGILKKAPHFIEFIQKRDADRAVVEDEISAEEQTRLRNEIQERQKALQTQAATRRHQLLEDESILA